MAIETEKKYHLTREQFDEVFAALSELDAEFVGEQFEVNELYGGEILKRENAVLRIRKTDNQTILTYKRRLQNQLNVKQNIEYETAVENAEAIENIITSLGFQLGLIYEKRRRTWRLRGAEVVLDELPFGFFMEIEGKITEIALVEMLLDADEFPVELNTYPKLTLDHFDNGDGTTVEARFRT